MLALAFSLSMFAYWTVLGRAVTCVAYPRLGVLRSWLVAPAVGLSVVLLGLMALNQAGIPIGRFATIMTATFGVVACGILIGKRPLTDCRRTAGFFLAVLFAWVWTGWPAFETGFNWISYANDDMANYCLAAQRFIDHGFYSVPTMQELAGRDYASYYFFMHVADMMRFGAEHIVAWSATIAHVKATQGFMPVILALSLVQITSVGALVLHFGRWRRRALVTVWLLAASPLFMLGTLYQLIAQVGGLGLLLATLALLLKPWTTPRRRPLIRYAIVPSITASGLCIFYPEVTPFAGLTFGAFALLWSWRRRSLPVGFVAIAAYTLLGAVVLLRHNVISYVSILVVQFNGAMDASNLLLSLFPYFMLPTGFSNLLGWMPIAHDFAEPVISLSIGAGMLFVAAALARSVRDAWRLSPAALLFLIQFAFAVRLFQGANDFGLYKLAMWMQPVLAAALAGWVLWLSRRRSALAVVCIGTYALTAAPTALYYTDSARGLRSGGLTELRLGSRLGLHVDTPPDPNAQLTSTIENVVAAKFAASELRGHPLALVSRDFFWPTTRTDFVHPIWSVRVHPHFAEMAQAAPLITARNQYLIAAATLWGTQFSQPVIDRPTDAYISLDPRLSLFNKFNLDSAKPAAGGVFVTEPATTVHNRLLFVHSGMGNHYYLGDRRRISFFQQEQDLFAPGQQFNGIGRFMLMRIENPSPKVYLRISATRTLATGRTAWKSDAVVHATEDRSLGAVGNGAFNLFIGPLEPQAFEGANYLAIDFKEFPGQIYDYRTGLKRLYHQKVPLDYRRLLGWARDISALTEAQYASLQRPRSVSRFPEDLATARDLEFAGAYEDGWLSAHTKFVFAGARPGELIRFRGFVPLLPVKSDLGSGTAHVIVNGQPVCDLPMPMGRFDWLLPIPQPTNATSIDIAFTASVPLPGRDQRPIAAKLEYIGLADLPSIIEYDYNTASTPRFAAVGVDEDGWMQRDAKIIVPPSAQSADLLINFENPLGGWQPGEMLHVMLDGSSDKDVVLNSGQPLVLQMRLPPSPTPRILRLVAPRDYQLAAPDTRRRALRVFSVRFAPIPQT